MPLHPQAREFVETLAAQRVPGWEELTPDAGRTLFSSLTELFGLGPAVQHVEDLVTDGGIGLRLYAPAVPWPAPAVIYCHGGGWVLGDLETHDALCRRLAVESACVVAAVDYRRAPEHPFPAALDDAFAATWFIVDHAAELGVDAGRLIVAGDSSGGNLAAAVALRARDQGGPSIHGQLLFYPVIGPRFDTPSYGAFAEGYGLTRSAMKWFWEQYLRDDPGAAGPLAVPAHAKSLNGLPPAHVVTAEFDVLRDEGERYAQSLRDAGVPTTLRRYDGMIHGFVHFAGVFDVGKEAVSDAAAVLRKMVATGSDRRERDRGFDF